MSETFTKTNIEIETSLRKKFKKNIWRVFTRTINEYELVGNGCTIGIFIDYDLKSILCAKLFTELARHGINNFTAVYICMSDEVGGDIDNIRRLCEHLEIDVRYIDSSQVSGGYDRPNVSKLCGCTRFVSTECFDDVISGILGNILKRANISCDMPKQHLSESIEIIRPLYNIRISDIEHFKRYNGLDIPVRERDYDDSDSDMAALIESLRASNTFVDRNIMRGVENINLKTIIAYQRDGRKYSFLEQYEEWSNKVTDFNVQTDSAQISTVVNGIRDDLRSFADSKYREFNLGLIPTVDPDTVIGIRTPRLRTYAKQLFKHVDDSKIFMDSEHIYYEEMNLHCFLIEQIRDYDECVRRLDEILPHIDNWATCDCMNPKVLATDKVRFLGDINRWLDSGDLYTMRFAIRMLMNHFLKDDFDIKYPNMVAAVKSDEYYMNMMIAWYFATALCYRYDEILPFLLEHRLDPWTHNKTIQKAVESYRIDDEQKAYLKTLKIKKATNNEK